LGSVGFWRKELRIGLQDDRAESTWLGRLDARAKLVGILIFVIACAILTAPELVYASLVISLGISAVSSLRPAYLIASYAAALPFILLAAFSVTITVGWDRGALMIARTSACVLALIVLVGTTSSFDLFAGLRRLGVPKVLTTLSLLVQKYIGLLGQELSRMTTARKARGFRGGKSLLDKYALRVISNTAGMVFVRSAGRADRAYEGLKSRGFDGDLVGWRQTRIKSGDLAFLSVLAAVSISLLALQAGLIA